MLLRPPANSPSHARRRTRDTSRLASTHVSAGAYAEESAASGSLFGFVIRSAIVIIRFELAWRRARALAFSSTMGLHPNPRIGCYISLPRD